jgi:hypothetical protein
VVFHAPTPTGYKNNKSRRFIAVEIEIGSVRAGGPINTVTKAYRHSVVEDGSAVRGHRVEAEICTAPAAGDVFLENMLALCNAMAEAGAEVNPACGLHVHVDARDFGYWDIRRLGKVWSKVEDALFGCVAPSRRDSDWCHPWGRKLEEFRTSSVKTDFANVVYGMATDQLRRMKQNKYASARYRSLNLHSWLYRGTVENRMHQGSTNYRKITGWAMLFAAIVDFAASNGEAAINRLSTDPQEALLHIARPVGLEYYVEERWANFDVRRTVVAAAV